MSQQNGATRFLALSPSDVTVKDPNTPSRFSYTREFLLSLAELCIAELPREVHLSISRVFEDACNLLRPPICDSDSRWDKSVAQLSSLKGLDNVSNLLHRSKKPYCPPHHCKALPPSSRDNNENETSGSSVSQEKVEWERWRKGLHEEMSYAEPEIVREAKEDQCLFNEHIDSKESSLVFLMSTALMTSGNLNNLQSTSNAIIKQLDASHHQLSLIEGASRDPNNTKSFSTQDQPVQGIISNSTLNMSEKSVNRNDASKHLISLLEKGMQLKESKACSNLNMGHPAITPNVMECQKESCPSSLLSQETCGSLMNGFEAAHEKIGNTSVYVQGSAGKIAKTEASEDYLSPSAGDRLYHSMVDKCESSKAPCRGGISPLHGLKQVDSISMKQNPLSLDVPIQQEDSLELCLPDEDSLIRFDEPYMMPDMENTVIGDSIPSPEGNQIKDDDDDSSNLTCDMIERLVESILNDDSSPAPHLDDPQVHHKAGLNTFSHSLHPLLNDTAMDLSSFTSVTLDSSFSSSTRNQPFPHDKMRRFDYDASHAMVQQMSNPDKLHFCFYYGSPTPQTQTPHPTQQKMNSNSMQDCTKCRFCP